MENVFDHNITEEEMKSLFGFWVDRNEWESYNLGERKENEILYRLYMTRGDEEKAYEFARRIPNDAAKYFSLLNVDHSHN